MKNEIIIEISLSEPIPGRIRRTMRARGEGSPKLIEHSRELCGLIKNYFAKTKSAGTGPIKAQEIIFDPPPPRQINLPPPHDGLG